MVVRSCSGQGASELFDLLVQREEEAKPDQRVLGFVSYAAFRTIERGMAVTTWQDKSAQTSPRRAPPRGSRRRSARWLARP